MALINPLSNYNNCYFVAFTLIKNYNMLKKVIILLLASFSVLTINAQAQLFNDDVYKFSKVLGYIDAFYVDSVNKSKLVETSIISMLKELDPHSVYISKEDVKKMNEPLEGNFEGIGIQFNILNDTLIVVSPISGGPSEKVGLMSGDRIVRIDTNNIAGIGITNEMVFKYLRGKKGTKVIVGILRRGSKDIIDYEIIRDKIPIYSVDAAYMVDKNQKIAYIKINRFAATTMQEYRQAIERLQKEHGAKHLILDLTDNSGGYLNMAFELADEFLKPGQMVVYTEGLKVPREEYKATRRSSIEYGKVVIMIDEGSASASEIVTGAIQDWDRGIVVGRRSFGKGLVQRPVELPDGSMMRLTIARYFTPTGRLIQKSYENGSDDYHKDLINRYNHGELTNADSIHFPDSLKFSTLVNKRPVFGGGGIMPDIFVSIDTTAYSDYYRDLIRKGVVNQFVIEYIDKNRKKLEKQFIESKKANGLGYFIDNFKVDDAFMDTFFEFAKTKKVDFDQQGYDKSKEHLKTNLKALIARNIFDNSEFFEIVNTLDPVYLKAVEVILNDTLYQTKLTGK